MSDKSAIHTHSYDTQHVSNAILNAHTPRLCMYIANSANKSGHRQVGYGIPVDRQQTDAFLGVT